MSPSPSSRLKSDSSFDASPSVPSSMSVASESSSTFTFTTLVLVALDRRSNESSGSDFTTTIGLEFGSGDEVRERDFGIESSTFSLFFSTGISILSCFALSTLSIDLLSALAGRSVDSIFDNSLWKRGRERERKKNEYISKIRTFETNL